MGVLRTSAALLVLLGAGNAGAQKTAVRIEYVAPAGCPDEAGFIEQLRGRTQRARFAAPDEFARTLKITVESRPGQSVARLEFLDSDSRRVKREVSGEDCAEVVSGIALVTALAIDARARNEAQSPPAKAPAKPPAPTPSPSVPAEPEVRGTAADFRKSEVRYDAGLGLMVGSAVGPSPVYGLSAFFGLGRRGSGWSARLTLARLEGPTVNVDRGEASFDLNLARVEGCPLAWTPSDAVSFTPCVALDAGLVDATGGGQRVARHQTAHAFWSAASVIARMQLDLQDFLVFEVQGEFGTPIWREEFVFRQPDAVVYTVPEIRWGAGAAVGFRF